MNRAREINILVSKLHSLWKRKFNDHDHFGPWHGETECLGRAYKQSLEIEKHGGKLVLPRHIREMLPKELKNNYTDLNN